MQLRETRECFKNKLWKCLINFLGTSYPFICNSESLQAKVRGIAYF